MVKSLPVYIYVPMDYVHVPVSSKRLQTPVDVSHPIDASAEGEAIERLLKTISNARNPVILVDALAARHGAKQEARLLVDALDFPTFATSMGKSIIDEDHPRFCGIYNGAVSYPGIQKAVEKSDCIINIGPLLADSNTGGHSRNNYQF